MTQRSHDSNAKSDSTSNPDVSRREFVNRAGVTGIGALGLNTLQDGTNLVDDSTEIVVVRRGDEPVSTRVVPGEWYRQVQRSRRVSDVLRERYGDESWLVGVQRAPTSRAIDGLNVPGVTAKATDVARAQRELPDAVEGLTVTVEEGDEPEPASCNTTSYNCVRGGSHVEVDQYDGGGTWHSAGCLVYYNGNPRLMTCAHGFDKEVCGADIGGLGLSQGSAGQWVGSVEAWDQSQDWAVVYEASNSEVAGFSNTVLGSGGYPIYGRTSRDGIDYVTSNGTTLYKYGAKTCETTGYSNGEHWWTKCYHDEPWVHTTNYIEKGDSGSPNYWYYEEGGQTYVAIIGTLYGWANNGDAVWPASWKVYDDHGITFGGTPTC